MKLINLIKYKFIFVLSGFIFITDLSNALPSATPSYDFRPTKQFRIDFKIGSQIMDILVSYDAYIDRFLINWPEVFSTQVEVYKDQNNDYSKCEKMIKDILDTNNNSKVKLKMLRGLMPIEMGLIKRVDLVHNPDFLNKLEEKAKIEKLSFDLNKLIENTPTLNFSSTKNVYSVEFANDAISKKVDEMILNSSEELGLRKKYATSYEEIDKMLQYLEQQKIGDQYFASTFYEDLVCDLFNGKATIKIKWWTDYSYDEINYPYFNDRQIVDINENLVKSYNQFPDTIHNYYLNLEENNKGVVQGFMLAFSIAESFGWKSLKDIGIEKFLKLNYMLLRSKSSQIPNSLNEHEVSKTVKYVSDKLRLNLGTTQMTANISGGTVSEKPRNQ